jgi:hypothetical protein
MSNQINISNLRKFLTGSVANQAKVTIPSYSNKISFVNAVSITSNNMNINSKTGTITLTGSTGSYQVPQPTINPLISNSQNSFISNFQNQVSVTSSGKENIVLLNNFQSVLNIEDVTNSGYTKNNSISNLYDSISSNYWNPQVNEGNINPYLYKLNYTFSGTSTIYKFVVKNNNDFPGFTNIRLYPTSEPLNYVDIEPSTDTNNMYINQTVALLLDQNGNPLFDTNQITAEFTLDPSLQPNTPYQYGQAYGVVYNNNTFGLRTGNYVSTNTGGIANKLDWSYSYLENLSTLTGTNNTSNNYLVSTDGVYRIAQNRTFYQLSTDGGITYTKKTLTTTSNMVGNLTGRYILGFNYLNGTSQSIIYTSNDYGNTFSSTFINQIIPNSALIKVSKSGENQCSVQYPFLNQSIYIYKSTTYGSNFQSTLSINYPFGSPINIVNLFIKDNSDCTLVITINSQIYIYTQTGTIFNPWSGNPIYSSRSPDIILTTSSLSSIEQNYNSNISIEGQYKTGLGTLPGNELGIIYTNNNDYTYSTITTHSLFTEWYTVPGIYLNGSGVKISNDGSKQIVIIIFNTTTISLYLDFFGNWQRSTSFPSLLNILSNIVTTDDFSVIQASGGYYYNYKGNYRTDPISYVSTDYGVTWTLNSAINPASSFISTNFFSAKFQTNKEYFQIKDLNQNQVLGVSDNGFDMKRDLRVTQHDSYVLGGTLTVGPNEESALLNDYTVNVDGTVSARNIVLLSDERFKNILGKISLEKAAEDMLKLNIVKYNFIDRQNDKKEYIGMIAQQVKKVINDCVDINKSSYFTPNGIIKIDDLHSLNYISIISYLIAAIQNSQNELIELEKILNKL